MTGRWWEKWVDDFTRDAKAMILWTRQRLTAFHRDWLASLLDTALVVKPGITLVHGSPRDPRWEYIANGAVAKDNVELIDTTVCLYGHTHIPVIFRKPWDEPKVLEEPLRVDMPIRLRLDRMFINPGSVGQPRDEGPRASYALVDLDKMTLTYRRVLYDVSATQKLMKQEKLPGRLIRRLRFGQ